MVLEEGSIRRWGEYFKNVLLKPTLEVEVEIKFEKRDDIEICTDCPTKGERVNVIKEIKNHIVPRIDGLSGGVEK